ncbi:MAG: alpha-L-fucosidase [Parabacteroides sp.]|nr:alpha-L-fucosidase [Parabacteroides sp.]
MECRPTMLIEATDSPEKIIEKAAHIVPTSNQLEALRNEFIAFIHFGPNTFTRMEWGNGMEDPRIFDLKELDTDQWCEAMKEAGMKKVIFTAKHHDGFVLWQSRYTKHGIMSSGFRDGKGDVLKDLSASCQKYGLELGVYLSPADLFQIESPTGLYGNLSEYTKRTIPREVPGRPFENKATFEFELDDYNEYFMNQLFELLTEYGPIHEVWFDGAHPKRKGGQRYKYSAWKELIHTLAPEAVVFGREDIRWCGNEAGRTRDTEWNVIPYPENPDTTSYFPDLTDEDLGSREQLLKARYLHYQQAETNTSIREGWFYRDDDRQRVRSADDVFDIYERAVGGNSTFLLNIPPNREGRFSAQDVGVLKEVGKRIRQTYGTDLLAQADGPKEWLDKDDSTYRAMIAGSEGVVIETAEPVTVNRFMLQEAIATNGERVEKHALDVWVNGEWKEIVEATNIGYKRILRFPNVTTDKFRVRVLESRLVPAISEVAAYYYESHPPRLTVRRNEKGAVCVETLRQDFKWNTYEQDMASDLNAGFKIYYTTDGTMPDENSLEYKEPFAWDNGEVKAVAILNGLSGEVCESLLGYDKRAWEVTTDNSRSVTIRLDTTRVLSGLAYTPRSDKEVQMIVKGSVKISDDGKTWKAAGAFEFGNLRNDPTRRDYHFTDAVKARYVRLEANREMDLKLAEYDLF